MRTIRFKVFHFPLLALLATLLVAGWSTSALAVPVQTAAPITGEIEAITITTPADHWSGGTMTVGGQVIIIPANLLINLPNDYQTLQELYLNAPAACAASGIGGTRETGLAKTDKCNARATGAQVTILANVTPFGNVIAGQVDIFKALESVNGNITYIDPTQGYFMVNGTPGSATTGVMIRVNDPTSRHTIQSGLGCPAGALNTNNCSADVRFKIDPDNYTFAYITGYPACIPGPGILPANCLDANRPVVPPTPLLTATAPVVAVDSRHFAPIKLGDNIKADGNFETVGGVTFLSAASVRIFVDLTTRSTDAIGNPDPTQPDYLIITEAGWDGPAYPASRVRGRFVTNASLRTPPTDIDYFSVHYDQANAPHEQILYTTQFNKQQGAVIVNAGTGVYDSQIRFSFFPPNNPDGQSPCVALRNGVAFDSKKFLGTPVFPASYFPAGLNISNYCTSTSPGDAADVISDYKLMAPIFREVMARSTRQQVTGLNKAIDIHGNPSQSGQYKLPVTIAYGAFEDINLGMSQFPVQFSGNPFLMDRRLSPNGCFGPCGGTQQPLTPFPFEGINPDAIVANFGFTGSSVPVGGRMLAFMDATGRMTGTLAWPPADPPSFPIVATPGLNMFPPFADEDSATTTTGLPVIINVLANDFAPFGTIDPASVKIATGPASGTVQVNPDGTITYTPTAAFTVGSVSFTYTVANNFGSVSAPGTVNVTITSIFHITSAAAPNGTISPLGVTAVTSNTSQTYTITPNAGFVVTALSVDGVVLPGATSYTFANVTADHAINAYFTDQTFAITASAGANGSVTPAGAVTVLSGANSTFTFTPNGGFLIANLVVDGVTIPAAPSYTFTSITGNHTISANFTPPAVITAAAGPNGTISPAGATPVTIGTNQTYTITPDPGFVVTALSVDGAVLQGASTYTFTSVTASHYINAYFGPLPATVTINAAAAPNGTITPAGANVVAGGANQTFTITPNAGFMVAALSVDGTVLPGTTSYTFTFLTADHYINAYFAPVPATVTITAAAGPGGTISPIGANVVAGGSNPTFTITPNAGLTVSALSVDGVVLPGATTFTFTNVSTDHYINAYFQ